MAKKVFLISFIVAVVSMIGLVACYILVNHKVDLGIISINTTLVVGYICLCVFVPSAVLAIISAVLCFFLPDYFYLGKKINS
jgi:hypothetical protein